MASLFRVCFNAPRFLLGISGFTPINLGFFFRGVLFSYFCRIRGSSRCIGIGGFRGAKRSMNTRSKPLPRSTWVTCRSTLRRSKFTSSFPEPERSRRSSWAWIRILRLPVASALFCKGFLLFFFNSFRVRAFCVFLSC